MTVIHLPPGQCHDTSVPNDPREVNPAMIICLMDTLGFIQCYNLHRDSILILSNFMGKWENVYSLNLATPLILIVIQGQFYFKCSTRMEKVQ